MRLLVIVLILLLIQSCSNNDPKRFDFVFIFGVGAKNELNTYDNAFTKDLVKGPSQTLALRLTDQEKQTIYNKLKEMHFTELPDSNYRCNSFEPQESYRLSVQMDGHKKQVGWLGGLPDKGTCGALGEVDSLIITIIHNRDEFKHSMRERAGYM
jgi:hypothetical protein